MAEVLDPGRTEQGFLADLKEFAEAVGGSVLGRPIRWEVEASADSNRKRKDVVLRWDDDGQPFACGEAKRPDQPDGIHALVSSNVQDALNKARTLGVDICFSTNFFEIALFDVRPSSASLLERLVGHLVKLVPDTLATSSQWWLHMPNPQREHAVRPGLQAFFQALRVQLSSSAPTADINEVALAVFVRLTDSLVEDLVPAMLSERSAALLQDSVVAHARSVSLDISKDLNVRHLVAQGVAEVLTSALFYRNIRDDFSMPALLRGLNPASNRILAEKVMAALSAATMTTGDYDTIFGLSPVGQWVLRSGSTTVLNNWKQLFEFVELLDFKTVTAEVVGSIFERLISPDRRREMGQHYTQPRLARAMTTWAADQNDLTYADISSGAGTFLVEVYARLRDQGKDHVGALHQIFGNDLDSFAVHLSTVNLATRDIYKGQNYPSVRVGDAFDIRLGKELLHVSPDSGSDYIVTWPSKGLDRIVGNPPFDERPSDEGRARASINSNWSANGQVVPPGMSGGNLAAWFVLLAASLLKPGGKFALVLPVGVLQNSNLTVWRRWLRSRYDVVVWHSEVDVWFSDARVATCVILATPRPASTWSSLGRMHFVDVQTPVQGVLSMSEDNVPLPASADKCVVRDVGSIEASADILIAGILPPALAEFEALRHTTRISDLDGYAVKYGNKLGHEAYEFKDLGKRDSAVVRTLQAFGMELKLNSKYLTPFLSTPRDVRSGEFDAAHSQRWVLTAPDKLPAGGALAQYVQHLRRLNVHEKPSVAARGASWFSVPWKVTHIAIQLHPGFEHQVWWSDDAFVAKNNFQLIQVDDSVSREDQEVLAAGLSSAFGALAALCRSSEIGCEGVRYVMVDQSEAWPVLDPRRVLDPGVRERLLDAYRVFRKREAKKIHQMSESAWSEWISLSTAVAEAAGAADPSELAVRAANAAHDIVVRRSRREALALSGRTRGGGRNGAALKKRVETQLSATETVGHLLEVLTSGRHEVRLRGASPAVQQTLDFDSVVAGAATPEEEALAAVLGEGFMCAADLSSDVTEAASRELQSLVEFFVGPVPQVGANLAYEGMAAEVRRFAIHWLQQEVHRRLS